MRELDRRIATLRLRLAEIRSRQEQLNATVKQYRLQLERIAEFAVYENADLDSALSMAEEVDSRLAQTEGALHHLDAIRTRAQEELDALLLTKGIDAARSELSQLESCRHALDEEMAALDRADLAIDAASLQERRAELESLRAQIDSEMVRLRRTISEASDAAARAVSAHSRGSKGRSEEEKARG